MAEKLKHDLELNGPRDEKEMAICELSACELLAAFDQGTLTCEAAMRAFCARALFVGEVKIVVRNSVKTLTPTPTPTPEFSAHI